MKKAKPRVIITIKLGPEAGLISNRNHAHDDKKKKADKEKCRSKVSVED